MAEGKTASSSGMEMFWIPGYLVSPEPGEEEHRWVLCPFSCHKSSSSRTAAWAQPWGWGRACPLLPHIKWDSKKMTNQSIWVGNSPRLCLLLQTFHTVTLQSDWGLCLLYIGKGTFILELAQGIVWNRGEVYTPIFNKLYTYQKGITGYEVYLNRIPTSLTTLKDKDFRALLANKYPR